MGIYSIGDLQNAPLAKLQQEFGDWAIDLQQRARGAGSDTLETDHEQKSISRETTFARDVGSAGSGLEQLKRVVLSLSEQVGRDLRDEGLQAKTIAIKLRRPDFTTITRQTTLSHPTDATSDIYQAATALLTAAMKRGAKVRLIGVRATNLSSGRQLGFFESNTEKHARADKAVDEIRERFGDKAIRRASLVRNNDRRPPTTDHSR